MKKITLANRLMPRLSRLLSAGILSSVAIAAHAQTMCVWDPLGSQGDFSNMFKDYQLAAKRWDVGLEIKTFVDESKSVDAFNAGECDIINMLGVRARPINPFTGTLEAPGVLDNYAQLREVMAVLNTEKAEKYMTNGDYEVVGIVPMGAGYPFVNDKKMDTMEGVIGKRMAVLGWDPLQPKLVQHAGVVPVALDLTQFGPAFNKGKVDMVILPAVMMKPLELTKGMGANGGIVHRPALEFTMQIMSRHRKFPPNYGHESRNYFQSQLAFALGLIRNTENAIDQRLWLYASTSELKEYNQSMREARAMLTNQGFYDKRMLNLLKAIRCRTKAADDPDCAPGQY